MSKLTLTTLLLASILIPASADMGFGGIMKDMMDIPKDMITETTDAMKEMKDSAKDAATDIKNDIKDNNISK